MSKKAITSPILEINNEVIHYLPGTLTFNEGSGEAKVEAQASGNSVETVYSDDLSTHIGKVKFQLKPTEADLKKARAYKKNSNDNGIVITKAGFARTFTNMAVVNDPEVTFSQDGSVELEFHGDSAI